MKENLSSRDRAILNIIARVRAIRAETLVKYLLMLGAAGADATRKTLERLCDKGFLVASPMPSGSQVFRLSHKGVALTGAPPAYAASPSPGIAAEMIAVSALAWRADEFLFPTKAELEALLAELAPGSERPRHNGRFVLRPVTTADENGTVTELRLHAFLAELRPADELVKRAGIIIQSLSRNNVFADLLQARMLGLTLAVPSRGVKASLTAKSFGVETSIVVVEELQDLVSH